MSDKPHTVPRLAPGRGRGGEGGESLERGGGQGERCRGSIPAPLSPAVAGFPYVGPAAVLDTALPAPIIWQQRHRGVETSSRMRDFAKFQARCKAAHLSQDAILVDGEWGLGQRHENLGVELVAALARLLAPLRQREQPPRPAIVAHGGPPWWCADRSRTFRQDPRHRGTADAHRSFLLRYSRRRASVSRASRSWLPRSHSARSDYSARGAASIMPQYSQ